MVPCIKGFMIQVRRVSSFRAVTGYYRPECLGQRQRQTKLNQDQPFIAREKYKRQVITKAKFKRGMIMNDKIRYL